MTATTSKEKDVLIKKLKDTVKDLNSMLTAKKSPNFSNKAMTVIKNETGFVLVELDIDLDTETLKVKSTRSFNSDFALTMYYAKKYLIETILELARKAK